VGAHSRIALEREEIGARPGAKHQPQHVEKLGASGVFQPVGLVNLLRLVPHEAGHSRAPGAGTKKCLSCAGVWPTLVGRFLVKDTTIQCETPERPGAAKILREALFVAVIGAAFAFGANLVSPRGLALTRNYFPAGISRPVPAARDVANTNPPVSSPAQLLAIRLKEQGLQWVDGRQAAQLFHDPRFQQGSIAFIDARDEQHYREGHIPGACEFDPYYPEKNFATVLPVCQAAEQIVVYCNGGDCDDSESAASALRDVGIANQKLFIYTGGITEWTTNGLPVEIGGRNSGNLRSTNK
jgi:rhodanese-related sulfurtransferase